MFCDILDYIKKECYMSLYIDNTIHSNDVKDFVFKYKAKIDNC